MTLDLLKTEERVGVGLRQPHYAYVLENKPAVGWFEVHSENFFGEGGPALMLLEKIRADYPLSFHGVGLSLGSGEGVDKAHLHTLKKRIDRFSQHIDETQTYLGREILIENPSSYLEYKCSTFSETDFLSTLCRTTGAKILLDINNVYVSAFNHGWDPRAYLQTIPSELVGEIHLAGHSVRTFAEGSTFLIDTHSTNVCEEVWALYQQAMQQGICAPVLIEWDEDIPDFATLKAEALKAESYLSQERKDYG